MTDINSVVEIEDALSARLLAFFLSELPDDANTGSVYVGHNEERNDQAPYEGQVNHQQDGYVRQDNGFNVYSFKVRLRAFFAEQTEERDVANNLRRVHYRFREYYNGRPDNLTDETLLQIESVTVGNMSPIRFQGGTVFTRGQETAIRRGTEFIVTIREFE